MKGIIFDFNGTLLYDTPYHYKAWCIFVKQKIDESFAIEKLETFKGLTNKDFLEKVMNRQLTDEEVKKYACEKEEIYRKICLEDKDNYHLQKGATELLDYLKKNKYPCAIATMSDENNVPFFVDHFNLHNWFDDKHIIYDTGLFPGKPDPTVYLEASKVLGIDPSELIVIEDAKNGIESARRAGIGYIIGICQDKDKAKELLECNGIKTVISDFGEFDRNLLSNNN